MLLPISFESIPQSCSNSLAQRLTRDGMNQTHLHSLGRGRGPVLMGAQTWILNLVCCKHNMSFKGITNQLFWKCPWMILYLKLRLTHSHSCCVAKMCLYSHGKFAFISTSRPRDTLQPRLPVPATAASWFALLRFTTSSAPWYSTCYTHSPTST